MRYIGLRSAPDAAWYRDRIRTVYVPWQAHPWHGIRIVLDRAGVEFLGWVFIRLATAYKFAREIGRTRPDEVEIGYRHHRSGWGRGVATKAAVPLVQAALADSATTAVIGCALAGNAGSLRVLEKLGLRRHGEVMLPESSEPTVKMVRIK